ncbi:hypothetical protein A0H81_03193 [Grifola frondosa]|uniref:Uncharacterized protein n=1 Tax=Grifola frondosa TaxID=5627 RepID=A0A1C7MJ48_GRIFR|nr:hypothetical protein A0H81_03193 [Grifola frondosa]
MTSCTRICENAAVHVEDSRSINTRDKLNLVLHARPQEHADRNSTEDAHPNGSERLPQDRVPETHALPPPRARAELEYSDAHHEHDRAGVRGVADDGIRAACDEAVLVAYGELEGEEATEVAVAREADQGAGGEEAPASEECGRDAHAGGRGGVAWHVEYQLCERVCGVVVRENDGGLGEAAEGD